MIRTTLFFGLAFFLLVVSASAQNRNLQRNPQPNEALINDVESLTVARHPASKYVNAGSIALADIDLEQLNEGESLDWLRRHLGIGDGAFVDAAISAIYSLKTAGASHIFVCASLTSIQHGSPLIVIPCENTSTAKQAIGSLLQTAKLDDQIKVSVDNQVVLVGTRMAIDRHVGNRPSRPPNERADLHERADLIVPMQQEKGWDHRFIVSLPHETRRELIAFWPEQLPENAIIQVSPKQLVADIKRVEFSFAFSPQFEVYAEFDTADKKAADRVRLVLERFFRLAPAAQDAVDLSTQNARVTVKLDANKTAEIVEKAIAPERERAEKMTVMRAAKQIGPAILNHHATYKYLPPRCLTDREGNPLLSWRVTLLPLIEQDALYNEFKLGEAWDSEANAKLSTMVVPPFSGGTDSSRHPGMTRFRAPVFAGSLWQGDGPPRKLRDVTDGTSNTIAIVYASPSDAVTWSSPEPWVISDEDPVGDVFGDQQQVVVVLLDGTVRVLRRDEVDHEKLKALLTIAGKEIVQW